MANFLQKVFNQISLQRDERLWMSSDDSLTSDRLQLLAEFPETQFLPQLKLECVANAKNVKLSTALREKGNLCYAQGDTEQALSMYNQSLQFASPITDEDEEDDSNANNDLSITYANRSAVWVDKEEFFLAIRDSDLAFEAKYPKELHYKLYERKTQCQFALQLHEEASDSLKMAIKTLEDSNLKGERRNAKLKALEKMAADINTKKDNVDKSEKECKKYGKNLLPEFKDKHDNFPNLSNAIEVKYEKNRGRYCVANRKIESGELIAVEKPFVWMLDKDETRTHCWHCFRSVISPIPCHSCAGLVFCGPKCREEASTYHRFECGITEIIFQSQIGGWALAYRALTSKPFDYFYENKNVFDRRNELMGYKENKEDFLYSSDDIMCFHNLVTHDHSDKKLAPELMMQAMTALFLLRCLRAKSYYPPSSGDPTILSDTELYLSQVLHHFMRVTYYNTHEITTITEDTDEDVFGCSSAFNVTHSPDRIRVRRIGRATNPSLALLNHSCDPNYRRVSVGRNTLGFATKTIEIGDEITDTYCPTFASRSQSDRQEALNKYRFICNCICCKSGWPELDQLERKFHGLPAEMYQEQFSGSKEKDALKKQLKRISTADHLVARIIREPEIDLNKLLVMTKRHLDEINKLVKPPHYSIAVAENKLYHVLLAIYASNSNVHYSL